MGKDVRIFNFVNAYGCSIDDGSKVGAFVEIQKGATIGKNWVKRLESIRGDTNVTMRSIYSRNPKLLEWWDNIG